LVIAGQKNLDRRYEALKKSMLGAIFLGVPHDGSRLTFMGKLVSYSTYWLGSSTELLEALEPGAKSLRELNDSFLKGYGRYDLVNFFETLKSGIWGVPLLLVGFLTLFLPDSLVMHIRQPIRTRVALVGKRILHWIPIILG
jgi:hypothetical protein